MQPAGLMPFVFSATSYCISALLVVCLCSDSQAVSQESSPVLGGIWTATAGSGQVLRGTWSGQTLPHSPNTVRGSWTLFNEASELPSSGDMVCAEDKQGLARKLDGSNIDWRSIHRQLEC